MEEWGGIADWRGLEIIDAEGKFVLPAFCDAHTHTVFAKSREEEFVDRIHGLSYEEIALRGGGILNSAARLQEMSEDELFEQAMKRIALLKSYGTAGGSFRMLSAPQQAYLPGLGLNYGTAHG